MEEEEDRGRGSSDSCDTEKIKSFLIDPAENTTKDGTSIGGLNKSTFNPEIVAMTESTEEIKVKEFSLRKLASNLHKS